MDNTSNTSNTISASLGNMASDTYNLLNGILSNPSVIIIVVAVLLFYIATFFSLGDSTSSSSSSLIVIILVWSSAGPLIINGSLERIASLR